MRGRMPQKNNKLGAVVASLMVAAISIMAEPAAEAATRGETCAAVTCLNNGSVQWVQKECTETGWEIVSYDNIEYDWSCAYYGPFENNGGCDEECLGEEADQEKAMCDAYRREADEACELYGGVIDFECNAADDWNYFCRDSEPEKAPCDAYRREADEACELYGGVVNFECNGDGRYYDCEFPKDGQG